MGPPDPILGLTGECKLRVSRIDLRTLRDILYVGGFQVEVFFVVSLYGVDGFSSKDWFSECIFSRMPCAKSLILVCVVVPIVCVMTAQVNFLCC